MDVTRFAKWSKSEIEADAATTKAALARLVAQGPLPTDGGGYETEAERAAYTQARHQEKIDAASNRLELLRQAWKLATK